MNEYTEKMKAFAIVHEDVQLLAALNTVDERCTGICITGLSQTKIRLFQDSNRLDIIFFQQIPLELYLCLLNLFIYLQYLYVFFK